MKPSNDQELVCGINAVKEIISIRPRSVLKLLLQNEKQNSRIESLSSLAKKNHIEIILEEDNFFERNFIEQNHQGVAILCNKRLEENETFLEKLLEKENLLILILDHLTDPHNVGACLRSAAAAGADAVMLGGIFAGTEEAPGELELYQGRSFKTYRGMGSIGAMSERNDTNRYSQDGISDEKMVPEGVEGRVPFKGWVVNVIDQLIGGIRQSMGYVGCKSIKEMHKDTQFVEITNAGITESHVHDVMITKEAPNYQRS